MPGIVRNMNPNHHPPEERFGYRRMLFEGVEFVFELVCEMIGGLFEILSIF
jgi:hypothetical protein